MNWQSWLALSAVILAAALVLGYRYRKDRPRRGGCDGNCSRCH